MSESGFAEHKTVDVSIIVIAFNEEERVAACLTALIHQATALRFEVIVIDDGSDDGTKSVVERFISIDPRVRLVVHDTNRGRGAARRTGQDSTSAPLVGFVDADIEVSEDWVDRCARELDTASAVSGIAMPDGDCAVIWRMFHLPIRLREGPATITGGNVMYRAEALEMEPFNSRSRLGEDFRQAQRMKARGLTLRSLSDLRVVHVENRTYAGAIRWMWLLGVDASSHPFEFRVVRLPDLTWLFWLAATAGTALSAALGLLPSWLAPSGIILGTAAIDFIFLYTRFHVRPSPLRWVTGLIANAPLLFTYLVGRTWGFLLLTLPDRRAAIGT